MRILGILLILALGIGLGVFFEKKEGDKEWAARERAALNAVGKALPKKLRQEFETPEAPPPAKATAISQSEPDTVHATAGGFDPKYIKSAPLEKSVAPDIIPVAGKLVFNAERVHQVSARVAGRLDKIFVFEGAHVVPGQELAREYSPDYISAENEFLLARGAVRTLASSGPAMADLLADARATEESARMKLHVFGASDTDIETLERTGVADTYLTLRAVIEGVVRVRNMDPGAYVNVGDAFMTVNYTGQLWYLGNIYEQDYPKIKLGMPLQLESTALPGKTFAGKVSWIAPSIDPATHTLSIRCDVQNPAGQLRPELFVSASLSAGERPAWVAPKAAVLQINDTSYVMIDKDNGVYKRVAVKTVPRKDGQLAIVSGLTGGEKIVVEGAILVNQLLEGVGAGND